MSTYFIPEVPFRVAGPRTGTALNSVLKELDRAFARCGRAFYADRITETADGVTLDGVIGPRRGAHRKFKRLARKEREAHRR